MNEVRVSREEIYNQLKSLGLSKGDNIYLRCDIGKIGKIDNKSPRIILNIILDIIGEKGTLVCPAFTQTSKIGRPLPPVVHRHSPSNTGALAALLIKSDNAIRSLHPTHSMISIGNAASKYLKDHKAYRPCFSPLKSMMQDNAKMLLIGCLESSPGFSTVHLAQYELGLTKKHWLRFFYRASYLNNSGNKTAYVLPEAPGCSRGFGKFYKIYEKAGILQRGHIGKASSMLIDMESAYNIEKEILTKSPNYAHCDNLDCLSCRAFNGYNLLPTPLTLILCCKKVLLAWLRSKLSN